MKWTVQLALVSVIVVLTAAGVYFYRSQMYRTSLPFDVFFTPDGSDGWEAYGGSWERNGTSVVNRSDERGAKLIGGSAKWSNYELDLDMEVLGSFGDAGALVRVSDAERGVDSYYGYYVGLRSANNTFVIGRADHEWREFAVARMQPAVQIGRWYHLRIAAYECKIVAAVSDGTSNTPTRLGIYDPGCVSTGKVGLRSYASGGQWKSLHISPLSSQRFNEMLQNTRLATPESFRHTEANFNSAVNSDLVIDSFAAMSGKGDRPLPLSPTNLGDIYFTGSDLASTPIALVHGTVTLSGADTYIQDSTGAALLRNVTNSEIRIGDELAVQGQPLVDISGVTFAHPSVKILHSREPISPTFATAAEASQGTYNNRFIQIEGRVVTKPRYGRLGIEFSLDSNGQVFVAVLPLATSGASLPGVLPGAHVRLTGITRSDERFSTAYYPFAVLLRSNEDVVVTAAPPWWGWQHIAELAFLLACCLVLCALSYSQVLRWRFQAVMEERSRMAREIHDTLAQSLAAIAFQLESSLAKSNETARSSEPLTIALQMAKQSRKDAHATIATLRSMQTESTLLPMLDAILRPLSAVANIELHLEGDPQCAPPAEVGHQILRIAQEAVSNAIRHSSCSEIRLQLRHHSSALKMTISDNGDGFEIHPCPYPPQSEHFGLIGMRERARSIGGSLLIESNSSGTTIFLGIPLEERITRFAALQNALTRLRTKTNSRVRRSL